MSGPVPNANILEITPYKGGQKLPSGWKLSSNENPLGASPAAQAAIAEVSRHLELYPDGSAAKLREAIGKKYGINPDRTTRLSGLQACGATMRRRYDQRA